jgi:hypothetical protein
LHRTVAEFLDWMLLPPTVWTTFPAGWGKLGKATAGSLRGAGLKVGMPDCLIFHQGRAVGIELKTDKGKLTIQQETMHERLTKAGVPVYVCRSMDQVFESLQLEMIPMRSFNGFNTQSKSRRPPQPDARPPAP